MELARTVAERPPIAARLAKQAVLAAEETALSAGLENERRLYELAMATEDRVEGMKAFLEKREPKFEGTSDQVERSASSAPARWAPASPRSRRSAATRPACTTPSRRRWRPGIERLRAASPRAPTQGLWSERRSRRGQRPRGRAPRPASSDLAECDLVIEAAPEDLELKRELFAALAEACGPEAILATNTSSLPVTRDRRRGAAPRARRRHALLQPAGADEAGRGRRHRATRAEAALEATTEVGRRMGRTPIRAKDSPGFIANRLARPFTLESLRMLAEGVADAATIDRVCRLGGGFRMGPFELIDLIGLDVNLSVARSFYAQGGEPERWRPSPIQEELVAEGRLGRKSGRGFYDYGDGTPHREPDPDLGIAAPTLDPERAGRDRPRRRGDPPPPRRPDRQRGRLRARRGGRLARRHGHGDAARLQLAARPARADRADRPRPRRRLLEALRAEHGEAYRPAPGLRAEAEGESA